MYHKSPTLGMAGKHPVTSLSNILTRRETDQVQEKDLG